MIMIDGFMRTGTVKDMKILADVRDLLVPGYFKDKVALDNFLKSDPGCLAYGWSIVNHVPTVIVFSGKALINKLPNLHLDADTITFDDAVSNEFIDKDPPIPSAYCETLRSSPIEGKPVRRPFSKVRDRILRIYGDRIPKYCNFVPGQMDYRISDNGLDIAISQKEATFDPTTTIAFVNGLFCYPTTKVHPELGAELILAKGATYLKNQRERDRGIVFVDFKGVANISGIYKLAEFEKSGMVIKSNKLDPNKNSILLILDGRMVCPNMDYIWENNGAITLKQHAISGLSKAFRTLDRQVCQNKFASMAGNVRTDEHLVEEDVDLLNCEDSYVVVLDRPGLQLIRHSCLPKPVGRSKSVIQCEFPGYANGIMMDYATYSVRTYQKEVHDMTFYAPESAFACRWEQAITRLNVEIPIDIWTGDNNVMSTHASLHRRDSVHFNVGNMTVWPDYHLVEFVFLGED